MKFPSSTEAAIDLFNKTYKKFAESMKKFYGCCPTHIVEGRIIAESVMSAAQNAVTMANLGIISHTMLEGVLSTAITDMEKSVRENEMDTKAAELLRSPMVQPPARA